MNHVSTRTIESKECPGVRFVIRKMTKRRKDALDELQAPFHEKLKPLYEEYIPLNKEREEAKENFSVEKLKRWSELLGQIAKIDANELTPIVARYCLVRIENLEIT